jgi:hypothetical protein
MPESLINDPIFPERVISPEYGPDHLPVAPVAPTDIDAIRAIAQRAHLVASECYEFATAISLDMSYSSTQTHRLKLVEALQRLATAVEQAQDKGVI